MITIGYSTRKHNNIFKTHLTNVSKYNNEIIEITNDNEYSLTEAYNKVLKKAKNNIVILVHDDVVLEKDFDQKILRYFKENKDYGVLGLAGSTNLPKSGQWWQDRTKMVGRVYHQQTINKNGKQITKNIESKYSGKFPKKLLEVCIIDGLFMAVHKDRIKPKTFNKKYEGFHFYDLSFSFKQHLNGVKVGVITDMKIIHKSVGNITDSEGNVNKNWDENRKQFIKQFESKLPYSLKPDIIYKDIQRKNKKTTSVITVVKEVDKFDNLLESLLSNSLNNNFEIIVGTEDLKIYDVMAALQDSLLADFDINLKVVLLENNNYAKQMNILSTYSDNEYLMFVDEDIVFMNDCLGQFIKNYDSSSGLLSSRIHFTDTQLIYHNGYKLYIKNIEKQNRLVITHDGYMSPYDYNETEKKRVIGVNKKLLFVSKKLFNLIKFDETLEHYYFGLKLSMETLKHRKNNNVVVDAVCTTSFEEKNSDKLQKDYSTNIVSFVNNNLNLFKNYLS